MSDRKHNRRPILICGILAAALLCIYGCDLLHDTINLGKMVATQGAMRSLTDADEDELGQSVARLVANAYEPSEDKKLIEYVNLVGFTLVSSSSKPDGQYMFGVLDTDDIGSYAGPNGYILITRGALQSMHDEAELAGILAHEMTHSLNEHAMANARAAAIRAKIMDPAKMKVQSSDVVKFMDGAIDTVVRGGYDRAQEEEADRGAVALLLAAGYDPHSYANYLGRMAALQQESSRAPAESAAMRVMTAHPGLAERSREVAAQIPLGITPGATLADRFRTYVR